MYFISRLVVVALLVQYSIKQGLNHFNALPVKYIPIYITASSGIIILYPLYLSLSNIYIKYPLSSVCILLNCLTSSNLTLALPISFNFLLNAAQPIFIQSIISLNCPIVTIYKSFNISAILASLFKLNSPGVVVTTLGSIFVNTYLL